MSETPKLEFDVLFKIDSNCLEILCMCENGLNFSAKKFNTEIDYIFL